MTTFTLISSVDSLVLLGIDFSQLGLRSMVTVKSLRLCDEPNAFANGAGLTMTIIV